jgi:hypothetical protein
MSSPPVLIIEGGSSAKTKDGLRTGFFLTVFLRMPPPWPNYPEVVCQSGGPLHPQSPQAVSSLEVLV